MESRRLLSAFALLAFMSIPGLAVAQTTTGVIDGVIEGPDGQPLPGVTVTANSPALIQRDMTAISDADGYYRLNLLPPGTYELTYRIDGFQPLDRSGVVVQVGQATPLDVALRLAGVEETALVTAEAPNIDPKAAKLGFNYTGELVENIPTARNMPDLFATIPGVESVNNLGGGIQPGTTEVQNVLGAGERSSQFRLDGANTTDSAGQWNTQDLLPYDIIEEIQVLKAAKPAEVPFQGGLFNVISKSGGNTLSGQVGGYVADESLQSTNTESASELESNELIREYEVTGSLGGPLVRDRLWWFAAGRLFDGESQIFGFPADVTEDVWSASGKLTYQPHQSHRINANVYAWDQEVSHFFFGFSPALALDERASAFRTRSGETYALGWSGILSDNVLAEFNGNFSHHSFDQLAQPGAEPAIVDLATGLRSRSAGTSAGAIRDNENDFWNLRGSVSWFVPEAAGRHDFKFGVEYTPTTSKQFFDEPGDHQLHTLFGRTFAVRFLSTPSVAVWDNDLTALYAQDSWAITDRLTLNLGLRYMHTDASTPETQAGGGRFANTPLANRFPQMRERTLAPTELATYDTVEPRFAATYQLGDTGRTILRLGASRYYHNIPSFDFFVLTPGFPFTWVTLWFDNNEDFEYQVGEEGPLLFSFGGQLNEVDPDLQRPFTDELIFGISHEPIRNVQLSANFIYRKDDDLTATTDIGVPFDTYTPVDVLDPGPDGIEGTGDDGTLTVFAQDPDTIGDSRLQLTNPESNEREFKGFELTASKRFADNWQAVGSLVVSEMEVIRPTVALSTIGLYDTPNGLVNAEGLDPANRTIQAKLQGTYRFDFGLGVSGLYRYTSGNPYTRELVVTGLPQGPFNVRAEPRGESKTDPTSILDLRLEQSFLLSSGQLGVILDVFNVFNASPSIDEGTITGVDYGETRSVQTPRLARLGVRYTW